MEPRFRLPKNILNGIGQIPRFNLDFTKLPKLPFTRPAVNLPKAPTMPVAPVKLPIQAMPVNRGVVSVGRPSPQPVISPVAPQPIVRPAPKPKPVAQTPAPQPVRQTGGDAPFAAGIRRIETGLDPLTKQLLFGLDGRGGFIPGAMRAAEKVFFDDEGKPVVIEEQVAGLTPNQLRAAELAR